MSPLTTRTTIGIALAAYRPDEDFFWQQLVSIEAQTYRDWFCYVSFDSPMAELLSQSRFASFGRDPRFVFDENEERLGHMRNFERAIRQCIRRGADLIACSDQDDIWGPRKLELSRAELLKRPFPSLVHCNMQLLWTTPPGEKDAFSRPPETTAWEFERRGTRHTRAEDLVIRNVVGGAGMLMDSELARLHPSIPEEFSYHDWWYAVVAGSYGGVWPIDEPLYTYRQHATNVVGLTAPRSFKSVIWRRIRTGDLDVQMGLWLAARGRAEAVERSHIPTSQQFKRLFFSKDFGLHLGMRALRWMREDPVLAKLYLARASAKATAALQARGERH